MATTTKKVTGKPVPKKGGSATDANKVEAKQAAPAKPRTSPGEFASQVRTEFRRVSWPTRKETFTMAMFVGGFSILMSLFFLLVDTTFGEIFRFLLNRGS